jgi:hypothetical protein
VNSPPPKPEVILTNFFAEPTVLLVPIASRAKVLLHLHLQKTIQDGNIYSYLPTTNYVG